MGRCDIIYDTNEEEVLADVSGNEGSEGKDVALQRVGARNPKPESVQDELFQREQFFDPRDLVQVKYEMLRRVQVEGSSVADSATAFGFSRPSFYRIQDAYESQGLPGLLPRQRGPRGPHKAPAEIRDFLLQVVTEEPELRPDDLAKRVQDRFEVTLHPRTILRALEPKKKR